MKCNIKHLINIEESLVRLQLYLGNYFKNNFSLVVFSFVSVMTAYGYELFNFSLSIDEELKSFVNNEPAWIAQGRWGTYFLLKLFMPELLVPFLPILVAVVFLVITNLLIVQSLGSDNIVKAIFCTISLTFPSSAFFMEFNTYNFAVAFGMAVTATAGAFMRCYLRDGNRQALVLPIVLLALALSVYQGIVSVWVCLVALYALRSSMSEPAADWPSPVTIYVGGGGILCVAMVLYKLTDYAMQWLYQIRPDQYLANFTGWQHLGVSAALWNVLHSVGRHLAGKAFYGEKTILVAWLLLLLFLVMVVANRHRRSRGWQMLSCTIFIASPFAMSLAVGSPHPIRSMVGLPLMVGGVWYAVAHLCSPGIRGIVFAAALVVAYTNSFAITRLFYSDHLIAQADRDLANRVMDRVSLFNIGFNRDHPLTVAFIGSRPPPQAALFIRDETFGTSFFDFGGPNQERIHFFLKTLGIEGVRFPTKEQFMTALAYSQGLEDWPHAQAVTYVEDMVIVRLSKPTEKQMTGKVH